MKKVFSVCMMMIFGLIFTVNPAMAETIEWKMGSCWSHGNALIDPDKHFVEAVHEMAGDRIKIKFYSVGEIVPAFEVLGAVSDNTLQAAGDWAGYWTGKETAFNVLCGFPMVPRLVDYATWIYKDGGIKVYNEIYGKFGVVYFPHCVISSESGIRGSKPFKSFSDFKGAKIRMAGKLQGLLLHDLGVIPVNIAGEEIYQALERGLIDGAEYSMPNIDWSVGLQDATTEWSTPAWHQTAAVTGVAINKEAWESLPKDLQAIIKHAAQSTMLWSIGHFTIESGKATKRFLEKGININILDDASLDKIEEMAHKHLMEEAKKNPLFARALYSYFRTMEEVAPYRNNVEFPIIKRKVTLPNMELLKQYSEGKRSE